MALVLFILRLVLTCLAIVFVGWVGYILALGLSSFFSKKNNKNN